MIRIKVPPVAEGCENVDEIIGALEKLGCTDFLAGGEYSLMVTLPEGYTADPDIFPRFIVRDEAGNLKITGCCNDDEKHDWMIFH